MPAGFPLSKAYRCSAEVPILESCIKKILLTENDKLRYHFAY